MENCLTIQYPYSGQGTYTAQMIFSSSPLGSMFNRVDGPMNQEIIVKHVVHNS